MFFLFFITKDCFSQNPESRSKTTHTEEALPQETIERYEELKLKAEELRESLEKLKELKEDLETKSQLLDKQLGTNKDDSGKLDLGMDCNPKLYNCKIGLECTQVLSGIYRCAKFLKAYEECGRSLVKICGKGLSCVNTGQLRKICDEVTTDGLKECFTEPLQVCKPSLQGEPP